MMEWVGIGAMLAVGLTVGFVGLLLALAAGAWLLHQVIGD
jgi:hypothetical protein